MDLKIFRSIFPFISAFVIGVGLIRTITFYEHFNIRIVDFIGIEEILVLFADDLLWTVIGFVVPTCALVLKFLVRNMEKRKHESKQAYNLKAKFLKVIYILSMGLGILSLIIVLAILYREELYYYANTILAVYIGLFFLKIFLDLYERYHNRVHTEKLNRTYLTITIICYGLLVTNLLKSAYDAFYIRNGKFIGTVITTSDTIYRTDLYNIYLGKTKDYTFLYNNIKNSPTVISNSEIKEFVLVRNSLDKTSEFASQWNKLQRLKTARDTTSNK